MRIPLDVYVDGVFMDRVEVTYPSQITEIEREYGILGHAEIATAPRSFFSEALEPPRPYAQAHLVRR